MSVQNSRNSSVSPACPSNLRGQNEKRRDEFPRKQSTSQTNYSSTISNSINIEQSATKARAQDPAQSDFARDFRSPASRSQNQKQNSSNPSQKQQSKRRTSPYMRERSQEQNDLEQKTKKISKKFETVKLTKKIDIKEQIRRQQVLRMNVNCFQYKLSKSNNKIIPTLPKFLLPTIPPLISASKISNL